VRCHVYPSEEASGRLSVRIWAQAGSLYRLYERRGATTWNFYAVVGDEAQQVPSPKE
jgi:hypothetical protein